MQTTWQIIWFDYNVSWALKVKWVWLWQTYAKIEMDINSAFYSTVLGFNPSGYQAVNYTRIT